METLSRRKSPPSVVAHYDSALPSASSRRAAMFGFAGLAALVATYVWVFILRVPMLRPVGSLFGQGPASAEGWAPVYAPPLFATVLTLAILHLYFRKQHRWSLLALAGAGFFAVVFGAWSAYWVKNLGYTWYFVRGASVLSILSVQAQMAPLAFGRAMQVLIHAPLLPAIGAVAGALLGMLLRCPLRSGQALPMPGAPAEGSAPKVATHRAGWFARIATAIFMALLGGAVGYGIPLVGLIVMPLAGLIWFFLAFRGGVYVFSNVLIGSGLIAILSAMPLALMGLFAPRTNPFESHQVSLHPFLEGLLLGVAVRIPVFVLISVVLIKLTLLLSRTTASVVHGIRSAEIGNRAS